MPMKLTENSILSLE